MGEKIKTKSRDNASGGEVERGSGRGNEYMIMTTREGKPKKNMNKNKKD